MSKITPTIGRRIWFFCNGVKGYQVLDSGQPLDAGVIFVHSNGNVNLSVTDHKGTTHAVENVSILPEDETPPAGCAFARWMPYQTAQAATKPASETGQVPEDVRAKLEANRVKEAEAHRAQLAKQTK